jgi:hypothetical protein
MIRHVVMLTFTDPADAAEAKDRLDALVGVVPELLSLQVDLDVLRTHSDLEGLKAYRSHPAHVAFLEWMQPRVSQRASVDAEA